MPPTTPRRASATDRKPPTPATARLTKNATTTVKLKAKNLDQADPHTLRSVRNKVEGWDLGVTPVGSGDDADADGDGDGLKVAAKKKGKEGLGQKEEEKVNALAKGEGALKAGLLDQTDPHDIRNISEKVKGWNVEPVGDHELVVEEVKDAEHTEEVKAEEQPAVVEIVDNGIIVEPEETSREADMGNGVVVEYDENTTIPDKPDEPTPAPAPTPSPPKKTPTKKSKPGVVRIDRERAMFIRERRAKAYRTVTKTPPQPQNKLEEDVKKASAPPKRVVSDGHWRKNQPAARKPAQASPAKKPTPTPTPKAPSPEPQTEGIKITAGKLDPATWLQAVEPSKPKPLHIRKPSKPAAEAEGSDRADARHKRRPSRASPPRSPRQEMQESDRDRERDRRKSLRRSPSKSPRQVDVSSGEDRGERERTRKQESRRRPKSPKSSSFYTETSSGVESRDRLTETSNATSSDQYADNEGIRVYPSHRRRPKEYTPEPEKVRRRRTERKSSGSRSTESSDHDRPSSRTSTSPPRKPETQWDIRDRRRLSRAKLGVEEDRRRTRRSYSPADDTPQKSPEPSPRLPSRRNTESRRQSTKVRSDEESEGPPPKEYTPRPPSHRKTQRRASYQKDIIDDLQPTAQEPASPNVVVPEPPRVFGSRLEQWLGATPDPFVDRERPSSADRPGSSGKKFSQLRQMFDQGGRGRLGDDASEITLTASTISGNITLDSASVAPLDSVSNIGNASPSKPIKEDRQEGSPSSPFLRRKGARHGGQSPIKAKAGSSPLRTSEPEPQIEEGSSIASGDASSVDPEELTPGRGFPESPRRMFPSTGKRLSTIVSVETFSNQQPEAAPSVVSEQSEGTVKGQNAEESTPVAELSDPFNPTPSVLSRRGTSIKRRLAKHSDLMSVLSLPKTSGKSIVSARSIRTNRSRLAATTLPELMNEVAADEVKYKRELHTLVDGLVPVLMKCVLSKADADYAAELFCTSPNAKKDPAINRTIIEMARALERLKSVHKRMPAQDADQFVSWAQSALRVYTDYLKAWRLGFQEVVIALGPTSDGSQCPKDTTWDDGMPIDEEGYVLDGNGERVDMAFILKRPLVRLKYLAKTFKSVNGLKPSDSAKNIAEKFQTLAIDARTKMYNEKARLEDEAAAAIDPTRARDPRTMAPLAGVQIDPSRKVKARDFFDMSLQHTSGQILDCRVQLVLRDNAPEAGQGGDVLVCEVDGTTRWLLFPPIEMGHISARNGDLEGEIVAMIRGQTSAGVEWHELMSLSTNDEQAGFEWVQMLGLEPVPPPMTNAPRFATKPGSRPTSSHGSSLLSAGSASTTPLKSRTPSPREIEVPIGVKASITSKRWSVDTSKAKPQPPAPVSPATPDSTPRNRLRKTSPLLSEVSSSVLSSIVPEVEQVEPESRSPLPPRSRRHDSPSDLNDAMQQAGDLSLKRTRAKRLTKDAPSPVSLPSRQRYLKEKRTNSEPDISGKITPGERPAWMPTSSLSSGTSGSSAGYSVWTPTVESYGDEEDDEEDDLYFGSSLKPLPKRESAPASPATQKKIESVADEPVRKPVPPRYHRRASSVPTLDLPTIPKLRKPSQQSSITEESVTQVQPVTPDATPIKRDTPASAPAKLRKRSGEPPVSDEAADTPPKPPPHRTPSKGTSPMQLKASTTPQFSTPYAARVRRRSSSPLKHEYEPSTATSESSSSESEESLSQDEDDDMSDTSESSDDEVQIGMQPFGLTSLKPTLPAPKPPASLYSLPNETLSPSQSASQAPYRTVPKVATEAQTTKTIASIFCWSHSGQWQPLHPDECSITVSPGLIEAFELTAAHTRKGSSAGPSNASSATSTSSEPTIRPLIALELTPLVPLRRGTALDISIRSPPTANSRLKADSNVMFRSRNTDECEALYQMINQARINNPTYIALQNARGPYADSTWNDRKSSTSSWWKVGGLKRRDSYRAKSTRSASVSIAGTESSVGTMNTAFSALKRFTGPSRLFNPSRSRDSSSAWSSSSGSGASTPTFAPPGADGTNPASTISNAKIRLYHRETLQKWRDMGSARLCILPPHLPPQTPPQTAAKYKRILITGKTANETLLDVTLSESCFERVARTGIAVSVWEEVRGADGRVGSVGDRGGVGGVKVGVWMVQCKSEREAAWFFGLVGKLRY